MGIKKTIFFVIAAFCGSLLACADEATTSSIKTTTSKLTTPGLPVEDSVKFYDQPDYKKGLDLVAKSDCWSCHKINEQSIGPSYKDVAAKYDTTQANYKLLAGKIIKGGKGVWGEVPMNAHTDISQEDAIAMTKYILLLNPKK